MVFQLLVLGSEPSKLELNILLRAIGMEDNRLTATRGAKQQEKRNGREFRPGMTYI